MEKKPSSGLDIRDFDEVSGMGGETEPMRFERGMELIMLRASLEIDKNPLDPKNLELGEALSVVADRLLDAGYQIHQPSFRIVYIGSSPVGKGWKKVYHG